MGAITVAFGNEEQIKRYSFRIFAPWLTVGGFYILTLATALETFICLVMLFPAYAVTSSIGGLLAGWTVTLFKQRRNHILGCFIILPLMLSPIEGRWVPTTEHRTVVTHIVIHAEPQAVWRTIKNVPDINTSELRWSFSHAIGIPRPKAALLAGKGVGAIRDIYWEQGIHFREIITSWDEGRAFSYRVDVTPAAKALLVLDTHVVIGDEYFDVVKGGYEISQLDGGGSRLTLKTTYRISTRMNFYGIFWANLVLDDFHRVVLDLIGDRAEESRSG